jgi:hypothetical protein
MRQVYPFIHTAVKIDDFELWISVLKEKDLRLLFSRGEKWTKNKGAKKRPRIPEIVYLRSLSGFRARMSSYFFAFLAGFFAAFFAVFFAAFFVAMSRSPPLGRTD